MSDVNGGAGGAGAGGAGAGGGGSGFSLDTAFDHGLAPESARAFLQERGVKTVGDVVNWAAEAETARRTPAAFDPTAKIDITKFAPEHQKILTAKKLETAQALMDQIAANEKFYGSLGDKPLARPKSGELVKWFGDNKDAFGVPKTPTEYTFNKPEMPEGFEWDGELENAWRTYAHERNIPKELFQDLADFGAQMQIKNAQRLQAAVQKEQQDFQAALKQEWGKDLAKNTEIAQFAVRKLGVDGQLLDQINSELGSPGLAKLFYQLGNNMEESKLITGDGNSQITSKAQAQAELDKLDQTALFDKSHAQHAHVVAEQERLMKIIHS